MSEEKNHFSEFFRRNFIYDDPYDFEGPDTPENVVVSTRLPVEDEAYLEILAPRFGMSKSKFIASLLDVSLREITKKLPAEIYQEISEQIIQETGAPNWRIPSNPQTSEITKEESE
jgi:hypothetical protein